MRTYGRVKQSDGSRRWVEVTTAPDGSNDYVYLTTLAQNLLLNLGESPFYADWGIPSQQSVMQQIAPDLFVARTQSRFAQYFASLIVSRDPTATEPTYRINAVTNAGALVQASIAV